MFDIVKFFRHKTEIYLNFFKIFHFRLIFGKIFFLRPQDLNPKNKNILVFKGNYIV